MHKNVVLRSAENVVVCLVKVVRRWWFPFRNIFYMSSVYIFVYKKKKEKKRRWFSGLSPIELAPCEQGATCMTMLRQTPTQALLRPRTSPQVEGLWGWAAPGHLYPAGISALGLGTFPWGERETWRSRMCPIRKYPRTTRMVNTVVTQVYMPYKLTDCAAVGIGK